MSMLLRTGGLPPVLLVADLTYDVDSLIKDQAPGTGDAKQLRSSFAKVRNLKKQLPDLVILASHDPGAAETLRATTQAIVIETKHPGDEPEAHRQGGVSTHHDGH
jgi:ABC-type polysaccharide/polyol phosphate transport system ATPase subunit